MASPRPIPKKVQPRERKQAQVAVADPAAIPEIVDTEQ